MANKEIVIKPTLKKKIIAWWYALRWKYFKFAYKRAVNKFVRVTEQERLKAQRRAKEAVKIKELVRILPSKRHGIFRCEVDGVEKLIKKPLNEVDMTGVRAGEEFYKKTYKHYGK